MTDYNRFKVTSSKELDKYLDEGWVIIETAKITLDDYGQAETRIDYHIGLPAKAMVTKLLVVIKDYEEHGFKEKLFENVAKSYHEELSDYDTGTGFTTSSKTARYIEGYENWVNNEKVSVLKKIIASADLSGDFSVRGSVS